MGNIKLQPNSKIMLIKKDKYLVGIYYKDDIVYIDRPICELEARYILELEELPLEEKYDSKLFLLNISEILNEGTFKEKEIYEMNLIAITRFHNVETLQKISMNKKPEKISLSSYYQYQDEKDQICLFNKQGRIIHFEKMLRNIFLNNQLQLNNIEFKWFTNGCIMELILQIEEIEELHFFLKVGENLEVYKTFYSMMSDVKEYYFESETADSEYIDFGTTFYNELMNHSIMESIRYNKKTQEEIREKEKIKKEKIRHRIREEMIKHPI